MGRLVITNSYGKTLENGLGIYQLDCEDGVYITGVVYMDQKGDFWFVAPNWSAPGLVASVPEGHPLGDPIETRVVTPLGKMLVYQGDGRGTR